MNSKKGNSHYATCNKVHLENEEINRMIIWQLTRIANRLLSLIASPKCCRGCQAVNTLDSCSFLSVLNGVTITVWTNCSFSKALPNQSTKLAFPFLSYCILLISRNLNVYLPNHCILTKQLERDNLLEVATLICADQITVQKTTNSTSCKLRNSNVGG